jgi:hypothetical protein
MTKAAAKNPSAGRAWARASAWGWAWPWQQLAGQTAQQEAPKRPAAAPPPLRLSNMSGTSPRAARRKGPFSKAALGRMAGEGKLTRDTYVWTAGQDGWMKAEDVQELAQLFTVLPPPPPIHP